MLHHYNVWFDFVYQIRQLWPVKEAHYITGALPRSLIVSLLSFERRGYNYWKPAGLQALGQTPGPQSRTSSQAPRQWQRFGSDHQYAVQIKPALVD
jgi:hypothetical protein